MLRAMSSFFSYQILQLLQLLLECFFSFLSVGGEGGGVDSSLTPLPEVNTVKAMTMRLSG